MMVLSSSRISAALAAAAAPALLVGCTIGEPPSNPSWQPGPPRGAAREATYAVPGAVPGRAPEGGAGASCADRREAARRMVEAAVDQERRCASDADCVQVEIATRCFDSCTRAVSVAGAALVRQSIARADAAYCASYQEDGCPFERPPCAPPFPPTCQQGLCQ